MYPKRRMIPEVADVTSPRDRKKLGPVKEEMEHGEEE